MDRVTRQPDYRDLAIEHSSDDLYAVAEQSAALREMTHALLTIVAEKDQENASLRRQLQAVKDEYQAHRERTMLASMSPEERASHLARPDRDRPAARTYTARRPGLNSHQDANRRSPHQRAPTRYVPVSATSSAQHGADA